MAGQRPIAVGLLRVGPTQSHDQVGRARVELALLASAEGYALIETFEIRKALHSEEAVLVALEQFAIHWDADALLVRGLSGSAAVAELAERARLLVHEVPDELDGQAVSGAASAHTRSKLVR